MLIYTTFVSAEGCYLNWPLNLENLQFYLNHKHFSAKIPNIDNNRESYLLQNSSTKLNPFESALL